MKEELSILIQAQYPLIYLVTPEEERAQQAIAQLAVSSSPRRRMYSWTVTRGMVEQGQNNGGMQHNTINPEAAIQWVINNVRRRDPEVMGEERQPQRQVDSIYVFQDLHDFITGASVKRALRDAIAAFKNTNNTIILMSPLREIPLELEKDVVVLDFPLPTAEEIAGVLEQHLRQTKANRLAPEAKEHLIQAALGLTEDEAQKVYRKAFVQAKKLTQSEVEIVLSEKKQLIRRNGILEYIEEDETIDSIGGLEELKAWLQQRSNAFSERAREYGLPQPKGMLILGVPGCGKSLIAKTTSRLWGLPLLRLDMGRVYDGSTVGRSEANLRSALKTAESISPAILFIDELDKAFAGGAGSSDSDGGTSSRIFGSFLTWMQEKKSPVFVMATANRIDRLPGEFLRKGRFDEIFFVDLPNPAEREDIFKIHLNKRRPQIERFDLRQLAKMSEGFSGAEIEQAIIAAMYEAFAQDREFTQLDIIAALKATLPLSRTMTEQVTALRDWAGQRARPAAASTAEYQRLEF